MKLKIESYCYGCHSGRYAHRIDGRFGHFRLWRYKIKTSKGLTIYTRTEFQRWEGAARSARRMWPHITGQVQDKVIPCPKS